MAETPPSLSVTDKIALARSLGRNPPETLAKFREKLGDIYTIDVFGKKYIILNHPHHVQHVLKDNARNYVKSSDLATPLRTLLGEGLVTSSGASWLTQRRVLQPLFHKNRHANLVCLIEKAITEELLHWEQVIQNRTEFDLSQAMEQISMAMMVQTVFGVTVEVQTLEAIRQRLGFLSDFRYLLFGVLAGKWPVQSSLFGRYTKAIEDVHVQIAPLLQNPTSGREKHHLSHWLRQETMAQDYETCPPLQESDLQDQITTLFVSGYETTFAALTWALYLLAVHPPIMERLYEEVKSARISQIIDLEILDQLPYTCAVFQEVLRLYPPGWRITRKVLQADEIDGFQVPAGASVLLFVYGIHRHPSYWEQPDQFIPERWLDGSAERRHPMAWIPFGVGPRQCIGKDLAMLEGQIALARIIQRFDIQLKRGLPRVRFVTTLKPAGKMQARLLKR